MVVTMLAGSELLNAVHRMDGLPKADIVRDCGYVSKLKDGVERLNYTAFYEALLAAKGFHLGQGGGRSVARSGRRLPYSTKVQFNGNLMVGRAYTNLLDLKPGDTFAIKLGRNSIRLVPLEQEAEDQELSTPA